MKPVLFVLCRITPEMSARIDAAFEVHRRHDIDNLPSWLSGNGGTVDYVLTDGTSGIDGPTLRAFPNLRAISSYGVGYDAVDVQSAFARGIPVAHTPGVLDEEVATTALLLLLSAFRNFESAMGHARSGLWGERKAFGLSRRTEGRRIGILGLGRIGKALARKLAPFNAEIVYCGRSRQDVPFRYFEDPLSMAREVEALVSIVPGGAETRHLIGRQVMEALGPEGILVNVGRGPTVNEVALIDALRDGRLGFAALDVFEDEPNIPEALRTLPNVILTPHVGSATVETRAAMGNLAIDNLVEHAKSGRMLTPVPECAGMVEQALNGG